MLRDSITVATHIDAPVDVVWRLLTRDRNAWWPEMQFTAEVGGALRETWTEDGRLFHATGTVTRCDERERLDFSWVEPGWSHPLEVVIRLASERGSASVTLTESGFATAHCSPSLPDEHSEGWGHHLARLKRVSESEQD